MFGQGHPVDKVEELSDDYVIEHYTEDFPDFESLETEIYYTAWEGGIIRPIGPTEPGYRAVVKLSEDAAEILSKYEWTEAADPKFNEELIEVPQSEKWYECEQFEKDRFQLVFVNYLYFDGKDTVVFDVHTF